MKKIFFVLCLMGMFAEKGEAPYLPVVLPCLVVLGIFAWCNGGKQLYKVVENVQE